MTTNAEYRVRLSTFDGPLDLLLYLIRRAEVEITDIPISQITDQYLSFLTRAERVDLDAAGEFLVMAATLMEIKSRTLQPDAESDRSDPDRDKPEEDPRSELVRQLLEYKRFRDAADALESRGEEWKRRFPVSPARIDAGALAEVNGAGELDMDDLTVVDLIEAYKRISESVNFERLGAHEVVEEEAPIEFHADEVVEQLMSSGGELGLRRVLVAPTRGEMIGRFLALLELVRARRVGLRRADQSTASPAAGTPSERIPEEIVVFARADEPGATPQS